MASSTTAANVAARIESMEFPRYRHASATRLHDGSQLEMSDEEGWTAGLAGSVSDADRGTSVRLGRETDRDRDELDDDEGAGWLGDGRRVRQPQAALVDLAGCRRRTLAMVFAGGRSHTEGAPQARHRLRTTVAHQRGMSERLQEVQRDRKQGGGKACRAPSSNGPFAIHA